MRSSRRCNNCARSGGGSVAGNLPPSPWALSDMRTDPRSPRRASRQPSCRVRWRAGPPSACRRRHTDSPAPGSIVRRVGLATGPRGPAAPPPVEVRSFAMRSTSKAPWCPGPWTTGLRQQQRRPVVWRLSRARCAAAAAQRMALIDLDLDRTRCTTSNSSLAGGPVSPRRGVGHEARPGQEQRALLAEDRSIDRRDLAR